MPEFTPFSAWLAFFSPPMPEFTPFSAWERIYQRRSGGTGVIYGRKPVPDGGGEDKARFGCAGDDGRSSAA